MSSRHKSDQVASSSGFLWISIRFTIVPQVALRIKVKVETTREHIQEWLDHMDAYMVKHSQHVEEAGFDQFENNMSISLGESREN